MPPSTGVAADAYRAGAGINELAARYDVHRTTVAARPALGDGAASRAIRPATRQTST